MIVDTDNCPHPSRLCIMPGLKAGHPLGFHKSEKLRYRNLVEALFAHGKSAYQPPLRLVWRALTEEELSASFRRDMPETGRVQFMITIPKKKHRKAVMRVKLRRLIREAYRLNRHILAPALEQNPQIRTLSLGFIFLDSSLPDYHTIEHKVRSLLAKVSSKLLAAAPGGASASSPDSPQQ